MERTYVTYDPITNENGKATFKMRTFVQQEDGTYYEKVEIKEQKEKLIEDRVDEVNHNIANLLRIVTTAAAVLMAFVLMLRGFGWMIYSEEFHSLISNIIQKTSSVLMIIFNYILIFVLRIVSFFINLIGWIYNLF
ncbi:hypothetical protein [Thermicanus aegyptius]|uniref:hypothetical protein n=1 Tax=Thermicanus aegyptius TaxID=94009 RepID=UPI00048B51BB|nr:hypothetical protein [Thermicanus aegyptius]